MMSSMGLGKSNVTLPVLAPSLSSPPCPSHYSFSTELSESEQRLSQIRELIASMPKPNQDTLWYLLEHLCRSGKLNILFIRERVGWGMQQGLYSNGVKVGKYPRLEQIDETGNFCAGVIL